MGRDHHKAGRGSRDVNDDRKIKLRGMFIAFEHMMLDSPGYAATSATARRLLIDMARVCGLDRNGAIPVSLSVMRQFGWKSNSTLRAAREQLQACGLVVETRKGGRRWPSWYALTWLPLQTSEPLDIDPRHYRRDAFLNPDIQPRAVRRDRTAKAAAALAGKRKASTQ